MYVHQGNPNVIQFYTPAIEEKTEGKIYGMEDEEEDVSCFWMTLRKREDTGN
jgi:hypothetical protein